MPKGQDASLYYALVDGMFYVSLSEQSIRQQIDFAKSRKQPAVAADGTLTFTPACPPIVIGSVE